MDYLPEDFVAALDSKIGAEIFCRQIDDSVTRFRGVPVRNGAGIFGANAGSPPIINTVNNAPRCLRDEALIHGIDRGEILIVIEMLGLDI